MATKSSGIAFMYVLGAILLALGPVWILALSDGGRSRLGFDRDGVGWFAICAGIFLLIAATLERRKK
ncbi:hypothetical protein [Cellulomonas carbonis]|uniref:Uncharacterized protein n=1 Tax=Cellulomonas carbonis T26 TaxID=947969 RepID=A0A0A0BK52_9CELL|nr:hypothetical protein [Cellulomonas carbonis]KGM08898.1 hypothetical protein N868_05800 [Cellulomonas carbonis T26]